MCLRELAAHPSLAQQSLRVLSNSVEDGVRTLVVTRPFQGLTAKHFTFAPGTPTIPFIAAIGASPTFAYHKAHTSAMLTLTPADGVKSGETQTPPLDSLGQ